MTTEKTAEKTAETKAPKDKKPARARGKGKAIIARMENVSGKSGVLLATSKKSAMATTLHWNLTDPKEFILSLSLPDGKGGKQTHVYSLGVEQARAVYEAHPRRVALESIPPACPLVVKK